MTAAHEPRRGPGVHLSVEDLSAAAEGAEPTAEGASEHLLDCAVCRAEVDAIARLLTVLETLEPPRIPQDVAIRIDAALAREATARAASPDSAPHAAADSTARNGSAREEAAHGRRRWRLSRGIGFGLASLAVVAGGLTLAVNLISSNTTAGSASAGSAALKPAASAYAGPERAPSLFNAPSTVAQTSPLALWVRRVLVGEMPDNRINSPCVDDPAFSGALALRVVNGTYQGVSATLVVYANAGAPATVRAVVYAQPCTASSFRVLAEGIVAK